MSHKGASVKQPERKVYKHIADNGGWDVVKVTILDKDIADEKALIAREMSYINKDDPLCLNTACPLIGDRPKKVAKPRSEERKAYDRAYYLAHKQEIAQRSAETYAAITATEAGRDYINKRCRDATIRRKKAAARAAAPEPQLNN